MDGTQSLGGLWKKVEKHGVARWSPMHDNTGILELHRTLHFSPDFGFLSAWSLCLTVIISLTFCEFAVKVKNAF